MSQSTSPRFSSLRSTPSAAAKKVTQAINRFPLLSFFVVLGLLLTLIVMGNRLRKPEADATADVQEPKITEVFTLGANPEIKVQAKVEKSGVIKLVALSGGVVQKIRVTEGSSVNRGTQLFSLSNNYQGGNIMSLTRQISQKSYQAAVDNYPLQKESIDKSRELTEKGEAQGSQLREIARKSLDETKSLISLNEEVLKGLNTQISAAEATNVNDSNIVQITQLKSSKAQLQGALNGLQAGLRNTEYLNSDDEEAAQIGRISKENTLKQLELQQRALDLGKELSLLNLKIAQVSEAVMYPTSPCAGVVERIHVKVGQSVVPGTLLATIRANDNSAEAIALVSSDVARSLSQFESSKVTINNQIYELTPRYIALEPTDGVLHAVIYPLPDATAGLITNGSYLEMTLPISGGLSQASTLYVPLDSVYQSQDGAYLFVAKNDNETQVARSRKVTLGGVFGRFVEVTTGLVEGDQVILNRSVLDGDRVTLR